MSPRNVVLIQARMASTRLPGKVLMDIGGVPMLGRVVERAGRATTPQEIIVATSTAPEDDRISEYCAGAGIATYRGSHYDVLDRYHEAAVSSKADVVVRVTGDCPLLDPALLDDVVDTLSMRYPQEPTGAEETTDKFDFVANRLPPPWNRTYPIGLDAEACTFAALDDAWRRGLDPVDREHVMPHLYKGVQPRAVNDHLSIGISSTGFRVGVLNCPDALGAWRWTVDTAEDLAFVRQIFARLGPDTGFGWKQVVSLLKSTPELLSINAGVKHKTLSDIDKRSGETN